MPSTPVTRSSLRSGGSRHFRRLGSRSNPEGKSPLAWQGGRLARFAEELVPEA